jgi:hypothetical protein
MMKLGGKFTPKILKRKFFVAIKFRKKLYFEKINKSTNLK